MSETMTIHDLFIEELQDIYHAEKQLTKALPKMARAASNQELREGIEEHLEETYRQCQRLEEIFDQLGMRSKAKPCEAMRGLIEEASEMMREDMPGEVMDVALISCAQKVEHYEIASYGTLVALAQAMGHDAIVSLLQETLEEERQTDEKLTELAQSEINPAAMETFRPVGGRHGDQERGHSGFGRNRQQRERYAEMQRATDRTPTQVRPAPRKPVERKGDARKAAPSRKVETRSDTKSAGPTKTRATERKASNGTMAGAKPPRRLQAAE